MKVIRTLLLLAIACFVGAPSITTLLPDQTPHPTTPTVTSISPNTGPAAGGTSVAVVGTNFTGVTAVRFGGTAAASYTVNSPISITATSPAGSGIVDLTVTNSSGTNSTSSADQFTFTTGSTPTITAISPNNGTTAGGTSVAVTGTNFTGATAVKFGATNAASFTVNSATSITATSAAGTGTVDMQVTNPAGTSATSSADQFFFIAPGFYVATTGNDSNAGTLASPFLTMARCQTAMRGSGTKTCYLRAGTYVRTTELLLTSSDNNETWTTYPLDAAQSAVLQYSGSGFIMNHIDGASNITFSNLTMDGGSSGGNGLIFGAVFIEHSSNGVYVRQNKFLNNFNQTDIYVYNSENIYFQGNVSGPNEYQPASGYSNDGSIHGHWFFTDNNLSGFARMGIEMGGDPVTILFQDVHVDRNTITKHTGPAADSMGISLVIGNSALCNTVWGNTILGTPGIGMWGIEVGAAITSVEQNTTTDIDVPIMIAQAAGTEIENNTITNFGNNPPFNNYAFSEDGGYNNTQWVGVNTLNGTPTTGWTGHPNSGSKPTVCTPSAAFP